MKKPLSLLKLTFLVAGILFIYILILLAPPKNFPSGEIFRIAPGETAVDIANNLYKEHIISSPKLFKSMLIFYKYDRSIQPGPYTFEKDENMFIVAKRLGNGIFNTDFIKVTFPEGITSKEMAAILTQKVENFDSAKFLQLAQPYEGYLFPDTYYFDPAVTPEAVVSQLRKTFDQRTKGLFGPDDNIKNVVIMASLLEREGRGLSEQQTIAGILSNRLLKNTLLQVDAPFMFLLGKESKDLTLTDLKYDSPYNTYLYKGLPPGPIGNPGLDAISAALHPAKTSYMFYLHDKLGVIHYAKTFAEHVKNKALYLR